VTSAPTPTLHPPAAAIEIREAEPKEFHQSPVTLEWRSESVVAASKMVHCITYDKVYEDLSTRLKYFAG
jgi:hypothetical protein